MTKIEEQIQHDLHQYLLMEHKIGEMLPDATDIQQKWDEIAKAYMPDGVREYNNFPTVSLGWMMYVGMAVASMWDENWSSACAFDNIYTYLRDKRGYDEMDEYIREEILQLEGTDFSSTEKIVGECASRTYNFLCHTPIESGTKDAFQAYTCALHQLYLMGAAVQLKRMGYNMVKVQ